MVAVFHVEAAQALKSNSAEIELKKTSFIMGSFDGPSNCGKIALLVSACLLICYVGVYGGATSATVYHLTTDSVCASDTLRCSCDLPTEWPVATRAFYGSAPYDASSADWYASTMGWIFDPIRGICPLGAVQVWVTLKEQLKWQGTLEQYQNDYSSGDINVPQRRLTTNEQGKGTKQKLFLAQEAAAFLQENTDEFSALMSDSSELAHNWMVKVGLASEKAPLVLNVGDDHPKGFHRALKTTSSTSSSKPKPVTHYNYRNCFRAEYKDQIEKVWETADAANSAAGAQTDGKSFVQAYSDYNLAQTLIIVNVIFASIFVIPFCFLLLYAFKYEYTAYGGPKYSGKGMFPFVAAFSLVVIFTGLAGRANSAITKNDFLNMPSIGWEPFLPGCNMKVTTGQATNLTGACLGLGITVIVIMVAVVGVYAHYRSKPKSEFELHEESLTSVDPKVPYLLDSAR